MNQAYVVGPLSPGRFSTVAEDPIIRRKIAKEARLYGLSLSCALPGAVAVYLSNRISVGVLVFLGCLLVLGPLLWRYERRRTP